ncbi:hypothetical protein ACWOFR_02740 [Carnobacterium gallinarum]|uniref:hypothetical protein n=1 Tax=Carnobacterium gallinarum TaxID=2749 RepID=UPI00054DE7AF|nr:hypothetical protein [Carnobacterium gallinarum]
MTNKPTTNQTIPIFNCFYELDSTLEFYIALGFKLSYYQKAPYRFASIQNGVMELSFYGDKKYDATEHTSGCYVILENITELHASMKKNLRAFYGKVPIQGLPRISRLNKTTEDYRFTITDPSGNVVIFGEPLGDSTTLMTEEEIRVKNATKTEKLYTQAYRYAYSKEDYPAAYHTLTFLLHKYKSELPITLLIKAKVLEIDLLISLDRISLAKQKIQDITLISVTEKDNLDLQLSLERLKEIKEEFH